MPITARFVALFLCFCTVLPAHAQDQQLTFATVERAPFATETNGAQGGFSLELMRLIPDRLNWDVTFGFYDSFPEMLSALEEGVHDGAIANISITAERERTFDFSQPIFEGGIGVLLLSESGPNPILQAILTRDFLFAILAALGLLFGSGMLMWLFERRVQPYFDRPANQAMFPSFWWALKLVVNGGLEERLPMSRMGRIFAVILVVASLFIVSIFVATITATMTVGALQDNVDSINDLDGRRVATIAELTSAAFMDGRNLNYTGYGSPTEIFAELEAGNIDAVVFDAPILSFYSNTTSEPRTRFLPRINRPENYGIALAPGNELAEQIDQTLLSLREDGTYGDLVRQWFGQTED